MVRRGTPLAEAAANSRSRRGASGPTSRSRISTAVSLMTVVGPDGVTRLTEVGGEGASPTPVTGSVVRDEPADSPSLSPGARSATPSACQVHGCMACQHEGDGGRHSTQHQGNPPPVVAPGPLRPPRGQAQRRHPCGLPLRVLCGPPASGQPPGRGQLVGPHQPHLSRPRRPPRDRRPGRLYPVDLLGASPRAVLAGSACSASTCRPCRSATSRRGAPPRGRPSATGFSPSRG